MQSGAIPTEGQCDDYKIDGWRMVSLTPQGLKKYATLNPTKWKCVPCNLTTPKSIYEYTNFTEDNEIERYGWCGSKNTTYPTEGW